MIKSRRDYIMAPERTKAELQQIILDIAKELEDAKEELRIVKDIDWEKIRRFF